MARPFANSSFIPGEGGDVPVGSSVPVSPAQVASQSLAGMEKNGCIYERKGFYVNGVSSILLLFPKFSMPLSETFHTAHSGTPARRGAMEEHMPAEV